MIDEAPYYRPTVVVETYGSTWAFDEHNLVYRRTVRTSRSEAAQVELSLHQERRSLPVTTADEDDHDCRGEAPCYDDPDCDYAMCETCGQPNKNCQCDFLYERWRDERYG